MQPVFEGSHSQPPGGTNASNTWKKGKRARDKAHILHTLMEGVSILRGTGLHTPQIFSLAAAKRVAHNSRQVNKGTQY